MSDRGPHCARLLARLLTPSEREPFLGDLEEEYRRRTDEGAATGAVRRWYTVQVLGALARRLPGAAFPTIDRAPAASQIAPNKARASWFDGFGDDLRLALRNLRRQRGFAIITLLTLAIGIGATAAMFTIVDSVLLRPLPFAEPERLHQLYSVDQSSGRISSSFSYPDFRDLADWSTAFSSVAAYQQTTVTLSGLEGRSPTTIDAGAVSANLLPTLGIEPIVGRQMSAEEDARGVAPVVLLSHGLWQRRFEGDEALLGKTIRLDASPHTVIGILPPAIHFLGEPDVVVPLAQRDGNNLRTVTTNTVIARLAEGSSTAAAAGELERHASTFKQRHADRFAKTWSLASLPLQQTMVYGIQQPLWVLLAAVACVLAIVCANIASLQLNRAAARNREIATRRALGASAGRLARLFLVESGILTFAGAVAGLLVAKISLPLLLSLLPDTIPRQGEIAVDSRVAAFACLVAIATGVLFALVPLRETGRRALPRMLQGSARGTSVSRSEHRLRKSLVVAEVAIATMLVIGAGLLLRTLWQLGHVHPGFREDRLLAVEIERPTSLVSSRWREHVAFFEQLVARTETLPGVDTVTAAYQPPNDQGWFTDLSILGRPEPPPGEGLMSAYRPVAPGYFRALGIPLLRGRALDARDHADRPGVVVVNASFVARYLPGEDPIGERIDIGAWWQENPATYEIVGVVGDVKFGGLDQQRDPSAMYFPHAQQPVNAMTLLVRTPGDPRALIDDVRALVHTLDPEQPLARVDTVETLLAQQHAPRRFLLQLLALFGTVALALAGLGVFGVLSYGVTRRRHELGVRLALGAVPAALQRMVLAQGLGLSLVGVALGLLGAAASSRLLASYLWGVEAVDPTTFVTVALCLIGVSALASLWPARRATRVDPLTILRHDT